MRLSGIMKPALWLKIQFVVCLFFAGSVFAQKGPFIHSHNDYTRSRPFYQAIENKVSSIEADIYADSSGRLLVGHDRSDLKPENSLWEMYINPIIKLLDGRGGVEEPDSSGLILLVDLKTPTEPTLGLLVSMLEPYPEVFDTRLNAGAVKVVITGNVPAPDKFQNYPSFIYFDGSVRLDYDSLQLSRIALFSAPFFNYSRWDGNGQIPFVEGEKIQDLINKAHALGKPIRFWGAPDNANTWQTLDSMKVDFINTDKIEECSDFFLNRKNR